MRKTSGLDRARLLEAIATEIESLGPELLERCSLETGLPIPRLEGERTRTTSQLRLFGSVVAEGSWVDARIDTGDPSRKPVPKPDVRSMLRPIGPVAVFGASNFPLAFSVAGGDTASALAAGCAVVVKAHPAHPGTCEMIGRAIVEAVRNAGFPEGTFSMVQGRSNEAGMALVGHAGIVAVGFTGSFKGGKALFDAANKRQNPIPVFAEMGSSNPVFILPRAAKERNEAIAQGLSSSVTVGVGQFCTNPGLVFLPASPESAELKRRLHEGLASIQPGVMLTSAIKNNFRSGLEKVSKKNGVRVVADAGDGTGHASQSAVMIETDAATFLVDPGIQEEIFGPSTIVVSGSDKASMIAAASRLHGHLTATVHGTPEDLAEYADLISLLESKVGRLVLNGYPTGVEVNHAMVHGGPFPATTDARSTSVGTRAIERFARPVCYQNFTQELLPEELQDANPRELWRMINGERTRSAVTS